MHINDIIVEELNALRQQATTKQQQVDKLMLFEQAIKRKALALANNDNCFVIHSALLATGLEISTEELFKIIEILKVMRGTAATQAHEAFTAFDVLDTYNAYQNVQAALQKEDK